MEDNKSIENEEIIIDGSLVNDYSKHDVWNRVNTARIHRKKTQLVLAKELGVKREWLANALSKKDHDINGRKLYQFCTILNISADYVLGLNKDDNTTLVESGEKKNVNKLTLTNLARYISEDDAGKVLALVEASFGEEGKENIQRAKDDAVFIYGE